MEDKQFVQLPWQDSSNLIFSEEGKDPSLWNRWNLIKYQLNKPIRNVDRLIEVIRSYNAPFGSDGAQLCCPWKLRSLREVIDGMTEDQRDEFFCESGVLHSMKNLVLTMPEVCPKIEWLRSGKSYCIKLHQMQIACILANSFFCTFPKRGRNQPSINFNPIYEGGDRNSARYGEKLKCLIHYFWRIHEKQPCGYVSFYRRVIPEDKFPRWNRTSVPLTQLSVDSDMRIEDADKHLQMDFANRVIGGGVIGGGCVQEEIRFVICPELIAARLFCEPMIENEALIIKGAERYCNYLGYADDFIFAGNYEDTTPFDSEQRRETHLLAVDALAFRQPLDQYREGRLLRELKKIYTGLRPMSGDSSPWPLATGNWGCGVYCGDPQLKSLLQIMAASQASRKVLYCTFNDKELEINLKLVHSRLTAKSVTVGELYRILARYIKDRRKDQTVFQFVLKSLDSSGAAQPRSEFKFLNADEISAMESGQKRSQASSSNFGQKQPRREIEREEKPHMWIEKEKSGAEAELSEKFSTSLGSMDKSNSQDSCSTDHQNQGHISPNLFSDDDIFSPNTVDELFKNDFDQPCINNQNAVVSKAKTSGTFQNTNDGSPRTDSEIPCTPNQNLVGFRGTGSDADCKKRKSLFDYLNDIDKPSLLPCAQNQNDIASIAQGSGLLVNTTIDSHETDCEIPCTHSEKLVGFRDKGSDSDCKKRESHSNHLKPNSQNSSPILKGLSAMGRDSKGSSSCSVKTPKEAVKAKFLQTRIDSFFRK